MCGVESYMDVVPYMHMIWSLYAPTELRYHHCLYMPSNTTHIESLLHCVLVRVQVTQSHGA